MPTFLTVPSFASVVLFPLTDGAGIAGIQRADSGGVLESLKYQFT